jgi:hypothetical protein
MDPSFVSDIRSSLRTQSIGNDEVLTSLKSISEVVCKALDRVT